MDISQLRASTAFRELVRSRARFGWMLTILMLTIYYGFILLVAYAPRLLSRHIWGAVTLGFPLGLGVILSSILLTGAYVARANGTFDRMLARVLEEAR